MPAASTRRIPAAERRHALIDAAIHEFAHGGLEGTPVGAVAREVGVAQPYVFSLFATKLELFLAAVERSFQTVSTTFESAAEAYAAGRGPDGCADPLTAMGHAYLQLLEHDRDILMLQHQAYAACHEDAVRMLVRELFAALVRLVYDLSGADPDRIDNFIRYGMWLNVAAAMGIQTHKNFHEWASQESPPWDDPAIYSDAKLIVDDHVAPVRLLKGNEPLVGDGRNGHHD